MTKTVEFKSGYSKLKFTRLDNADYPTFQLETNKQFSMSIPLARHLRTLVSLYGYNEIKRLVDNYPESLKEIE